MASAPKLDPFAESSVDRFAPHVQELQEFFGTRGVHFGSAQDLRPFVDRLESDASFRDETASMVRAVIYRERDGVSRLELMELLATAASGTQADHVALPELREAVRKLMVFVESVFRTRWNPGAAVDEPAPRLEVAAPAAHQAKDLFYRAQVVANGGVAETLAEERASDSAPPEEQRTEEAQAEELLESQPKDEQWHVPLEDFAPVKPERGPRVWLWVAGACALLLAFSAGLLVHQRMLVPLRDPNQPYEPAPANSPESTPAAPVAAAAPRARPSGTVVDDDWRARATSARGRRAVDAGEAEESASAADLRPRYMGPAVIGASPALMAGRLVSAPPPEYPALAKMTHVQGQVMVQAVVGKSGQVIRAEAISGHRLLRGAAVHEVFRRRYRPYLLDDRPRDVATIVTVDFRLK